MYSHNYNHIFIITEETPQDEETEAESPETEEETENGDDDDLIQTPDNTLPEVEVPEGKGSAYIAVLAAIEFLNF